MFKQLSHWYKVLIDSSARRQLNQDIAAFNRQNVYRTFAHNNADQHDDTEKQYSSNSGRESRTSPPQQEELQKQQAIILKNLHALMKQYNDYILNPAKLPSATMISIFEETLQAVLKLQNYQSFILPYLGSIKSINNFLKEHFGNNEGNMKEIHNLMQRIIPRQEAPSYFLHLDAAPPIIK